MHLHTTAILFQKKKKKSGEKCYLVMQEKKEETPENTLKQETLWGQINIIFSQFL